MSKLRMGGAELVKHREIFTFYRTWHSPGGIVENHKNLTSEYRAEVWTWHFINTEQECYPPDQQDIRFQLAEFWDYAIETPGSSWGSLRTPYRVWALRSVCSGH
jgi:hypothetical protein